MNNLAQTQFNSPGSINGFGSLGNPGTQGPSVLAQVISSAIGLLTVIGVLYFLFILITGAIGIISAGGDKGKYENARSKITTGVIGLVVLISAMFLVDLIATLLGIGSILDINAMITLISN